MYWGFSRYVHAGYELPVLREINTPSKSAAFMALFAPMDTAHHLHSSNCHTPNCWMGGKYKTLYDEISEATIRLSGKEWFQKILNDFEVQ